MNVSFPVATGASVLMCISCETVVPLVPQVETTPNSVSRTERLHSDGGNLVVEVGPGADIASRPLSVELPAIDRSTSGVVAPQVSAALSPKPDCPPPTGWDGSSCVSMVCTGTAHFRTGTGCVTFDGMPCRPECGPVIPDGPHVTAGLSTVDLSVCRRDGGPRGQGHIVIEFAPNGIVSRATADWPPFAGTPEGACVEAQFSKLRLPTFGGPGLTVGKLFSL
jgi:hypothetical protein